MATPKLRQREEGDYRGLAPAHSKPAAPALATKHADAGKGGRGRAEGAIGEVQPRKWPRYLAA